MSSIVAFEQGSLPPSASVQGRPSLPGRDRTSHFADLLPAEPSADGNEPPSPPIANKGSASHGHLSTRGPGRSPKPTSSTGQAASDRHRQAAPSQADGPMQPQGSKGEKQAPVGSDADGPDTGKDKDTRGQTSVEAAALPQHKVVAAANAVSADVTAAAPSADASAQPTDLAHSPASSAPAALPTAPPPDAAGTAAISTTDASAGTVAAAPQASLNAAAQVAAATANSPAAATAALAQAAGAGSPAAAATLAAGPAAEFAAPVLGLLAQGADGLRPKSAAADSSGGKPAQATSAANASPADGKPGADQDLGAGQVQAMPLAGIKPAAPADGAARPAPSRAAANDGDGASRTDRPAKSEGAASTPSAAGQPSQASAGNAAAAVKAAADALHPLIPAALTGQPAAAVAPTATSQAAAAMAASHAVPLGGVAIEIAAQAQAGKQSFEVRLDPPDLGRIDVHLHVDRDGNVSSRLVVERPETLDLLRRDAPQLERALQQAGLKTADNALQFSLRDHSSQHGNPSSQNAHRIVLPDDSGSSNAGETAPMTHGYGRRLGLGGGIDIRI